MIAISYGPSAGPYVVEATLDFGVGGSDMASVAVSASWATATSKIVASITDDARIEEALIENISVGVANRGAGTFTIWGHAPARAVGQFKVQAVGI